MPGMNWKRFKTILRDLEGDRFVISLDREEDGFVTTGRERGHIRYPVSLSTWDASWLACFNIGILSSYPYLK